MKSKGQEQGAASCVNSVDEHVCHSVGACTGVVSPRMLEKGDCEGQFWATPKPGMQAQSCGCKLDVPHIISADNMSCCGHRHAELLLWQRRIQHRSKLQVLRFGLPHTHMEHSCSDTATLLTETVAQSGRAPSSACASVGKVAQKDGFCQSSISVSNPRQQAMGCFATHAVFEH